jgi:SAM-dependent methyltransferase
MKPPAPVVDRHRIHGDRVDIDYDATRAFFDERASRAARPDDLTTVLYQDSHPEIAAARHQFELAQIAPHLGLELRPRVFDIGCGNGRWARSLSGHVCSYLGIDFSPGLIAHARAGMDGYPDCGRFTFSVLSAVDLDRNREPLRSALPFGLVIVAGVLLYLNDADVDRLMTVLADLTDVDAVVYVREPVALGDRLTLASFASEELNAEYSAVYRPADFYRSLLARELSARGFRFVLDEAVPAPMQNRDETTQHYFVLRRGAIR